MLDVPGVADIPGCGCGLHQRGRGTADPAQKDLYGNVMLKSYRNLVALGKLGVVGTAEPIQMSLFP